MYRLHGQDASWLYRESLTTPMHTLKIFLVELGPDQHLDFDLVRNTMPLLLQELPMLRQRPVFVPLGLHHPVMIEDPDFDLSYHLNRAALPKPGGADEFNEVLAQIHSHPLDQDRPLWQFWIVEGLASGQIALVQKIHHTLADGMASVNSILHVWQSAFNEPDHQSAPWQPEPIPTRKQLLRDALVDHIKHDVGNLPDFFRAIHRGGRGFRKQVRSPDSPTLRSMDGESPRTRWNYSLSSRRSFATAQLAVDDLKAIKDRLGGTLNDVVLAVVAGSVRNFLICHDELPEEPLVVTVPVSKDQRGSTRETGNSTTVMLSLLHTQVADPGERYAAIRYSSEMGKTELDLLGKDTFGLMAHYVPPALQQSTAHNNFRKHVANDRKFKLLANLSVSNVPGPMEKFSTRGNVVQELYSAGPLVEGIGLNITCWSYAGNMNFTLVGCMKALPDIERIAAGLEHSLQELQLIAIHQG